MKLLHSYVLPVIPLLFSCLLFAQAKTETLSLTFTTIDVPGAVITNVLGINTAGDVVGNYSAGSSAPSHGFLYSGGTFTLFDYPGQYTTIAYGINDSGVIAGSAYADDASNVVGFLYDQTTFTTIRAPGKAATIVYGINNAGDLVGGAGTTLSSTKAFEMTAGRFKNISPPGTYVYIYGAGINDSGKVAGFILNGLYDYGFTYMNGKFQKVLVPGTSQTEASGVNDDGTVVGWFFSCTSVCGDHGFVFLNGKYSSFDYPGAMSTFAASISKSGQIVGSYTLDNQTFHGFVTNPITIDLFGRSTP